MWVLIDDRGKWQYPTRDGEKPETGFVVESERTSVAGSVFMFGCRCR